jgi:hypothetical protein
MTELPIVLDDLIEEELQNQIEDAMFDCVWTFNMDSVFGSKTSESKYRKLLNPFDYDVSPLFYAKIKSNSNIDIYRKVIPLIQKGCDEIKFNIEKVERCCGGIHALIREKNKKDTIHVNRCIPHLVMLYYVNDSDGDTIIYDKTLDDIPCEVDYPDEFCDLNILHKISPKKGRILFFDGRYYHSPSSPTKSMRCIITIDLFGKFEDGSYSFPAPKTEVKNNTIRY